MISATSNFPNRLAMGRKEPFTGMVHMITMLTYIAQIDIGEYKNPFKCPEITMVTQF